MLNGKKFALAVTVVLSVGSLWMSGCSSSSNASSSTVSDEAVASLVVGNTSFQGGSLASMVANSTPSIRTGLATNGQKPLTIVLTCSDSRVPPEIIFNEGLGELFVIRVAGNVLDKQQLGSIEYAIEHLKTPVVLVVLGHTQCGAVSSTIKTIYTDHAEINKDENLGSILAAIQPAVTSVKKAHPGFTNETDAAFVDAAVEKNVEFMSEYMLLNSPIIRDAVELTHVKLVKYKYNISDGTLKAL